MILKIENCTIFVKIIVICNALEKKNDERIRCIIAENKTEKKKQWTNR